MPASRRQRKPRTRPADQGHRRTTIAQTAVRQKLFEKEGIAARRSTMAAGAADVIDATSLAAAGRSKGRDVQGRGQRGDGQLRLADGAFEVDARGQGPRRQEGRHHTPGSHLLALWTQQEKKLSGEYTTVASMLPVAGSAPGRRRRGDAGEGHLLSAWVHSASRSVPEPADVMATFLPPSSHVLDLESRLRKHDQMPAVMPSAAPATTLDEHALLASVAATEEARVHDHVGGARRHRLVPFGAAT